MTLAVAFIRRLPERTSREELVFAADTRLSGGQRLDHGTKIFGLPRSDALLAFAGDTAYAYPLAHQLISAITIYPRSADRRFPLPKARGHMLRVFEQVYRSIHGLPVGALLPVEDRPRVQFLFGGYIWQEKRFGTWFVDLDRKQRRFRFRAGGRFCFIGDREAVREAEAQTLALLAERQRDISEMDMEPFEVLREIIRQGKHPSIGGVPQVAKVYEHMNTRFFATLSMSEGEVRPHVFGRPVLPPESCDWSFFDPETLVFHPASVALKGVANAPGAC